MSGATAVRENLVEGVRARGMRAGADMQVSQPCCLLNKS